MLDYRILREDTATELEDKVVGFLLARRRDYDEEWEPLGGPGIDIGNPDGLRQWFQAVRFVRRVKPKTSNIPYD